ncbi:TIGR03503 family protein [Idiomarina sp. HP20-50]|uniref:TIGR03503 family protein n=1 Tax=Idiomarina sp. HP20-50 TaxID=3070813 RepID=UPI00294B5F7B|nr:TIGR03503 family protein [Idiomarina sp. HP20-50]MDV6317121.1 TIGR03503 family protein [Idiomarina sp. HP20-50]
MARLLALLLVLISSSTAHALQNFSNVEPKEQIKKQAMSLIEADITNELPIKGQTFRIDENVEEITLLFFREPGSKPLILIKPDGSKWYDTRYPEEKVTWYTDPNFDIVRIKKPQPGPWQAAGRIDEENKALVISDIRFEAEPLPNPLFQNEELKVVGKLYNGEEIVETARFRQTVLLDVLFVSTNNPDFDNFGAKPSRVAQFEDNGQGHDERAGDGIFTGFFNLDVEPGEWLATYEMTTPLYQRVFEFGPVEVKPLPVEFEVIQSEGVEDSHQLKIRVDDKWIDPQSLVINGVTNFPNGETRKFTVTQIDAFPHHVDIANLAFGKHLVDLDIFATTVSGREFEARINDFSFIANEPPPPEPTAAEVAQQQQLELERQRELAKQELEAKRKQAMTNLIIIVVVNIVLIGLALLALWWFKFRKKKISVNGDNVSAKE